MGTVTGQSVGIDIREDFPDVYLHPAAKEVRLPHNDEGTASLLALLRKQPVEPVVLESTGGPQRRLVRSLQDAGYAVRSRPHPWPLGEVFRPDIPWLRLPRRNAHDSSFPGRVTASPCSQSRITRCCCRSGADRTR